MGLILSLVIDAVCGVVLLLSVAAVFGVALVVIGAVQTYRAARAARRELCPQCSLNIEGDHAHA